ASSFLHDPSPTQTYPLSLHDALPIYIDMTAAHGDAVGNFHIPVARTIGAVGFLPHAVLGNLHHPRIAVTVADIDGEDFQGRRVRSEEHTSELQSLTNLVCRLLLEKKN